MKHITGLHLRIFVGFGVKYKFEGNLIANHLCPNTPFELVLMHNTNITDAAYFNSPFNNILRISSGITSTEGSIDINISLPNKNINHDLSNYPVTKFWRTDEYDHENTRSNPYPLLHTRKNSGKICTSNIIKRIFTL